MPLPPVGATPSAAPAMTHHTAGRALLEAVSAACHGDMPEAARLIDSDPDLTPCTTILCLARLVTVGMFGKGVTGLTCVVHTPPDDPGRPLADDIAAITTAVANGDIRGAHLVTHGLGAEAAADVVSALLRTAATVYEARR